MRIGIDFDNTIACYDGVFHTAAFERGLIPADLASSKNAVRDYLNGSGRKDDFTELQGYVYGARMDLVSPYPGFAAFLKKATSTGHELFIVSHKTRYPMFGPNHDMHAAAHNFLKAQNLIGDHAVRTERVFFELTKEDKTSRVGHLGIDVFIDDLPEILAMITAANSVRGILFDPDGHHSGDTTFERYADWESLSVAVLGRDS